MNNMKKKECPSCAMEIDSEEKVCPICDYEFPEESRLNRFSGIAMLVIFIIILIFYLI